MKSKIALITGVSGQDGSYLAEFLLRKGYIVHGLLRRTSSLNLWRITHLVDDYQIFNNRFFLHYADLTDTISLVKLLEQIQPDEIYNLASQSDVALSFKLPVHTADVTAIGPLRLLEAIKISGIKSKFFQASSSEMFGNTDHIPQNERTPFRPCSPYAAAKAYAHYITVMYREAYDLFACCGILFNHESPRRGENFVTRKITLGLARILHGYQDKIVLGNLEARRDWGYAPEYVEAMWLMLQQEKPDDYVIATGKTHSVKEFVELAFSYVGLEWRKYVVVDKTYYRPLDVDNLVGDASKAQAKLNWRARTSFEELIKIMLESDIELVKSHR